MARACQTQTQPAEKLVRSSELRQVMDKTIGEQEAERDNKRRRGEVCAVRQEEGCPPGGVWFQRSASGQDQQQRPDPAHDQRGKTRK